MDAEGFEARVRSASRLGFDERRRAERALSREVPREMSAIRRLLVSPDRALRRTVIEVLRRAGSRNRAVVALLLTRLGEEPDVKTRRRICVAIGETGDPGACTELLARLETEEHRYVQASLILALGRLGFRDWPLRWRRLAATGETGPVADALQAAGAAVPPAASVSPGPIQAPRRPLGAFLLRVHPGSHVLGRLEWKRAGLPVARRRGAGWYGVQVDTNECRSVLARLRTIVADYHVAAEQPAGPDEEAVSSLLARGCVAIQKICGEGRAPVSFRLALPRMPTRAGYRGAVKALSREVCAWTGWANTPSDYDLDLRVERLDGAAAVVWRHRAWPSARSGETRRKVPASIHPSVAAGLCHLALDGLPAGSGRRLIDPCCGAGTILREWLEVVPEGTAIGVDRSRGALVGCGRNLEAFRARADTARGDLRALPLAAARADVLIANPPFGIRVREHGSRSALARRLVGEAARVLRPGGVLVVHTIARASVEAAFRTAGFSVAEPRTTIRAGGLDVLVFAAVRSGDRSMRRNDAGE